VKIIGKMCIDYEVDGVRRGSIRTWEVWMSTVVTED